jgi:hypothetical protein
MQSLSTIFGLFSVLIVIISSAAHAQGGRVDVIADSIQDRNPQLYRVEVEDPTAKSSNNNLISQIILNVSEGKEQLTGKIGFSVSRSLGLYGKVTAPLSDGETKAQPIDLNGLASGTIAELGINVLIPVTDPAATIKEALRKVFRSHSARTSDSQIDAALSSGDTAGLSVARATADSAAKTTEGVQISLITKGSTSVYDYVDASLANSSSERHTSFSMTIAGGWVGNKMFAGFSYENGVAWMGEDAKTYNLPYNDLDGATRVASLVVGGPFFRRISVLAVEARALFDVFDLRGAIGVNPQFAYSFIDEQIKGTLPIYFLRDADGGLRGGIELGVQYDVSNRPAELEGRSRFSPPFFGLFLTEALKLPSLIP